MCYNMAYLTKRQEKYKKLFEQLNIETQTAEQVATSFVKSMEPMYLARGFDYPVAPIFKLKGTSLTLDYAAWGLIPAWVKDINKALELRNKTLNARVETLTDKASYRDAYITGKSIILMDNFYEHHKSGKQSMPYWVGIGDEPFFVATLSVSRASDAFSGTTFSIVTQSPNAFMSRLHNKPSGARMPMILKGAEEVWSWLYDGKEAEYYKKNDQDFKSHQVAPLSGAASFGNMPQSQQPLQSGLFDSF